MCIDMMAGEERGGRSPLLVGHGRVCYEGCRDRHPRIWVGSSSLGTPKAEAISTRMRTYPGIIGKASTFSFSEQYQRK